jgi:hypothetical protein
MWFLTGTAMVCLSGARASHINHHMTSTQVLTNDPVNDTQRVVVRQSATGFEQGIAAVAGLLTAGPIGSIAAWGALRGLQGKWAPWFIIGVPAATIINVVQIAALTPHLMNQIGNLSDSQETTQEQVYMPNPTPDQGFKTTDSQYQELINLRQPPQSTQEVIPNGKAFFKSGRTGKEELISVSISSRVNTNGHTVYDAMWADGYNSSYVFWSNGHAEIFSKDGEGNTVRTAAKFERLQNGSVKIDAETDAVTIFPSFNPATN